MSSRAGSEDGGAGSVLILGTGALATFFAARLSASGVAVTLLGTWSEALSALRTRGAGLDGRWFPVRATADPAECRGASRALVLVKSWQTARAALQLKDCLSPHGVALTLQNGLGSERVLADSIGASRLAVGVTTLGASLVSPGQALSGGEGSVILPSLPLLADWVAVLEHAGLQVQQVEDIRPLVWSKLAVNAAINPLTALLGVTNGELLEYPSARLLMDALADEASEVALAQGIRLPEPPRLLARQVAQRTARNRSSMFQDVLRRAPTEVDVINGAVVRAGERLGLQAPLNRALWNLVCKRVEN